MDRQGTVGRGKVRPGWVWPGKARIAVYPLPARKGTPGAARRRMAWRGYGAASQGKDTMPKKRQPKEVWSITRARIWTRDNGRCVHCGIAQALEVCHIDHIRSGKLATNADSNLRVLCRRCHVLRADFRHRGMIAKALADGIIPPDWRALVWDEV